MGIFYNLGDFNVWYDSILSPLRGDLKSLGYELCKYDKFYPHCVGILYSNGIFRIYTTVLSPLCGDLISYGFGGEVRLEVLSPLCGDYYLSIYVMMFLKIFIPSPPRGDYILRIGRNSAYKMVLSPLRGDKLSDVNKWHRQFYPHSVGIFEIAPKNGREGFGSIPTLWGSLINVRGENDAAVVPSPLCGDL